jgi:hypothetical protein
MTDVGVGSVEALTEVAGAAPCGAVEHDANPAIIMSAALAIPNR